MGPLFKAMQWMQDHYSSLGDLPQRNIAEFFRALSSSEPVYALCNTKLANVLIGGKDVICHPDNQVVISHNSHLIYRILHYVFERPTHWPQWMFDLLKVIAKRSQDVMTQLKESVGNGGNIEQREPTQEQHDTWFNFLKYGTKTGATAVRQKPLYRTDIKTIKSKKKKNNNCDEDGKENEEEKRDCNKNFAKQHGKPGLMVFRCPHSVKTGSHLIAKSESVNDIFAYLFVFYPTMPDIMIADYMCICFPYCVRRAPALCEDMIAIIDSLHGRGHVACSDVFNIEAYRNVVPSLRNVRDEGCEQRNATINKIRSMGYWSSKESFLLEFELLSAMDNRRILRDFEPQGIEFSNQSPPSIRDWREPWYEMLQKNNTNTDDIEMKSRDPTQETDAELSPPVFESELVRSYLPPSTSPPANSESDVDDDSDYGIEEANQFSDEEESSGDEHDDQQSNVNPRYRFLCGDIGKNNWEYEDIDMQPSDQQQHQQTDPQF